MGQSCREPLRLCSSLCLHGVCSPGKQTVSSQAALGACQKCRPHSFDRVCEPLRGASTEEKLAPKISTADFSRAAPPVWLRSTVPGRVSPRGPGFRKIHNFSEAAHAAPPRPNQMLTAHGGPVLAKKSNWPLGPRALPVKIFDRII